MSHQSTMANNFQIDMSKGTESLKNFHGAIKSGTVPYVVPIRNNSFTTNGTAGNDSPTNSALPNGPINNRAPAAESITKGAVTSDVSTNDIVGDLRADVARQGVVPSSLLLFSAHSAESLDSQINALIEYTKSHSKVRLRDLAYTLANRREHRPHRAFAVASSDGSSLNISAKQAIKYKSGCTKVVWVFTGQGAQWPGMGRDLLDKFYIPGNDPEAGRVFTDASYTATMED